MVSATITSRLPCNYRQSSSVGLGQAPERGVYRDGLGSSFTMYLSRRAKFHWVISVQDLHSLVSHLSFFMYNFQLFCWIGYFCMKKCSPKFLKSVSNQPGLHAVSLALFVCCYRLMSDLLFRVISRLPLKVTLLAVGPFFSRETLVFWSLG